MLSVRRFKITIYSLIILAAIVVYINDDPEVIQINLTNPLLVFGFNYQDQYLRKNIEAILQDQKGSYAVIVESLEDDPMRAYYRSADVIMPAGSLYKLFLIAGVYDSLEKGTLTEDQVLSSSQQHLIDVTGAAEYGYDSSRETISCAIKECLNRVAMFSDNYNAIMLAEKIGWPAVQAQVDNIGGKSTVIKSPISTTASDIALFFKKLYAKQIVSPAASEKIIELLAKAQINNRIPAGVAEGVKVAHKTGELSRVRNDAGIVFLDAHPYILVMLSRDLQYEDDGIEMEAAISKTVYNYFSNLD